MSVKRWLQHHDIPRRPAKKSLEHRGVGKPTAETLQHMVHSEHLSYREIAKQLNVSSSAISLWMRAYGIETPSVWQTRRGGEEIELPNRDELEKLYISKHLSQRTIGQRYGVSSDTISRLLASHGIETRNSGWNGGKRWTCQDGHIVRSFYEQWVDNWLYERGVPHEYEPPIPNDKRRKADFLANGWYIEVWGVTNSAIYEQRKKNKRLYYKHNNLPLIELPASSFQKKNAWVYRLQDCLI